MAEDKKLTDSEIIKAREVSLEEQIEHYNKRRKEVFDRYYRRNTEGNEDTLEICVLRESAVLISKLESIINRLQADVDNYKQIAENQQKIILDKAFENKKLKAEIERLRQTYPHNRYPVCVKVRNGEIYTYTLDDYDWLIGDISAEAYKEFAERLKEKAYTECDITGHKYQVVQIEEIDNILKELVGADNG